MKAPRIKSRICANFTLRLKLAIARSRLSLMEVAIMIPISSTKERREGSGEFAVPSAELEPTLQIWRKAGLLDKEDLVLVLLLAASAVVCLLTVASVLSG
jgi:hypothetical protein